MSTSVIYISSNVINAAIPFALMPVLTRYLSPADYGEVAIFQTFITVMCAFTGLSLSAAINRKYFDGDLETNELKNFIAACLQILLFSSSFVFLIAVILGERPAEWLGLKAEWIILGIGVSALSELILIRLGQWQIRNFAYKYGIFQISQSIINMLISLLLIVVLEQGANGRMGAQTLAAIFFAICALFLLKRDGLLSFFVWKPAYIKEALYFGLPLFPHVAGLLLLGTVDRFVISARLGFGEAGIYMVALQLASVMTIFFVAINNAYYPWLFERLRRDLLVEKYQIVRYTYTWFVLVLLCAALAFLVGPNLVVLIAGLKYAKAGEVVGWLALGNAFLGMYLMLVNYILYSKKNSQLSIVTVVSGSIGVILIFLLIGPFGVKGAAISYCISMAIRFLLTWWVAQRVHPMPWFNGFIKT